MLFYRLLAQVSQAHVTRVDASESVSRYKRSLRRSMRNKILRSADDKYRYILPFDQ